MQDFAVKKEQGAESLILSRSGDLALHRQVSEKGFNFGRAHIFGVALVMKEDESPGPIDMGMEYNRLNELPEWQGLKTS